MDHDRPCSGCSAWQSENAELKQRIAELEKRLDERERTDAGREAQVITAATLQTCKQQRQSGFGFIRDAVCGLARSIFAAVTGGSRSASNPAPAAAH